MIYRKGTPVCITNTAGDSIGYNSEEIFNSIPDATPLIARQGDSIPPYGFLVPEDSYNLTISGFTDSVAHFSLFSDSLFAGYRRVDADSTQTDLVTVNGNFMVSNPDTVLKTVQLRMVCTLPEKERTLVVSDFSVNKNDSVNLAPIDSTGWYLSNGAEAGQYKLWMREVSTNGEKKFYSAEVSIDAFHSHILVPDWTTLNEDSCMIFIDTNFDMVPDDSIVIPGDDLQPGCCITPGDANHDGTANISDLTYIVDYMFHDGPPSVCFEEFDNNGDCGDINNILDLTYFVDWMYQEGPAPVDCHVCE